MSPTATDTERALAQSRALVEAGRPLDAIERLTVANRMRRDPTIEQTLVDLRHVAFAAVPRIAVEDLPDSVTAAAPPARLVELTPDQLDVAALRHGLATQGCVLVRGMAEPARAQALLRGIDAALDGFDAGVDADPGWYTPFVPTPGAYRTGGRRQWVRASGAVWTADSPRMLFELTELIEQSGIGELVTEYLGERPVLSANKCTLRRVPLTAQPGWHQDGAFLGEQVRSLNFWLALDHCGTEAPGLDLVPRRFDHVVPSGTDGAIFDWSVAPDVVAREAGQVGTVRPEFEPGDVLLFDHLLLHSTAVEADMTRERHAMETWFFGPSSYPDGQIPLVL